jgi:signal transduction histidine kinase
MDAHAAVLPQDHTTLLRSLSQAAAAVLDPDLSLGEVLQAITDTAREMVDTHRATVNLGVDVDHNLTHAIQAVSVSEQYAPSRPTDAEPEPSAVYSIVCAENRVLRMTQADHSSLAAPLLGQGGRALGFIQLSDKREGAFTEGDEEIIVNFARLATLAIANAQARDALVAQKRLATLTAEVGQALNEGATLSGMLQRSADAIVRHLNAAFARIWTLNGAAEVLELQASAGMYTRLDGVYSRVPVGAFEIGLIAQEREAHVTNQVAGDPRIRDPAWAAREGLLAFAGYPLVIGGELVGVLAVFARHPFTDADAEVLATAARALALGIERKQAEAARDRALADVAAERRRLEISNRELDQFAYVASHDLRAPLRGIANLAQWIEEDLQTSLNEETRDMLALMRSRMHRLEALIDGVLECSRAGKVRGRPETVDVGTLVGDVIELLAPPPGAVVTVEPQMPTMVTERLPLQQVFLNLIGNALKHAARPGVRIVVGVRDAGADYEFFVSDTGPGIAPEYHERIWCIFQTLESHDKVEGSGIGLALVKKLVDTRGGRVWVESAPERGATFRFRWPKFMTAEED